MQLGMLRQYTVECPISVCLRKTGEMLFGILTKDLAKNSRDQPEIVSQLKETFITHMLRNKSAFQVILQPKHFKRTVYNLNVFSSLRASLAWSRTLRSHHFTVFCPSVPVYIQCRLERLLTAKVLSGEEYFGTYSLIRACLGKVFNTTKDI